VENFGIYFSFTKVWFLIQHHGGTNFGRTTGGPFITISYDYDAPKDEYGNHSILPPNLYIPIFKSSSLLLEPIQIIEIRIEEIALYMLFVLMIFSHCFFRPTKVPQVGTSQGTSWSN